MLQDTNAPQQYAESGASVALYQHSDGSLSEHRLSDQEQADSSWHPSCSCSPLMEVRF